MTPAEQKVESFPDRVENTKARLACLVSKLNATGECNLQLHQQQITRKHISLTGGNGRIYVVPTVDAFDIVLSGASLTQQLTPVMNKLCNRAHTDHKQKNARKQQLREPFWRVTNYTIVEDAVAEYSKTIPSVRKKAKHS